MPRIVNQPPDQLSIHAAADFQFEARLMFNSTINRRRPPGGLAANPANAISPLALDVARAS